MNYICPNKSLDDEDSKMKSYITRQFEKFMKNANGKGFDKDRMMHTKELDMLIIQVEMELNLHKTHCHFLVAQLQDLEPNVSRKH